MPETQAQYKARILRHVAGREPLPLLVGAYRIRLILADPGTAIQAFDQDRWAETGRYAATDPWRALTLFRALREANLALWHRLSPAEWERAGVHAERGVESIRDIAACYAGHDLNHFAQIEAILASAGTAP